MDNLHGVKKSKGWIKYIILFVIIVYGIYRVINNNSEIKKELACEKVEQRLVGNWVEIDGDEQPYSAEFGKSNFKINSPNGRRMQGVYVVKDPYRITLIPTQIDKQKVSGKIKFENKISFKDKDTLRMENEQGTIGILKRTDNIDPNAQITNEAIQSKESSKTIDNNLRQVVDMQYKNNDGISVYTLNSQ